MTELCQGASQKYKYANPGTKVVGRISIKKHGYPKRLAQTFKDMTRRCYSVNSKAYSDYGGRGIRICNEWLEERLAFFEWAMSSGYSSKLFIDRIDNHGDYSPGNCRWVTREANNNNKRNHLYVTYNGETLNVAQWEKKLGVRQNSLRARILNGWPSDLAIESPFDKKWYFAKIKPKKENRGRMGYGLAKLDEEKVREIKRRIATGESRVSIAKDFAVGAAAIGKIANGIRWAWV